MGVKWCQIFFSVLCWTCLQWKSRSYFNLCKWKWIFPSILPPACLTHPVRFPSSAWLTSGLTIIINRAHSLIISSHISPVKYLRSVFYFYFNCHYFYHRTIFFDNLVSPPSHQLSDISLLDFQTGTVWPILPALKSKHRCVIWSRQACCFHFSL